jgi:hypothetical protein
MNKNRIIRIAQLTLATAAAFTLAGAADARNRPFNKIILVRPTELPELARVPGQAMMLHATGDGRTLLYVEQNHGARLAIFDVTEPAHVKEEGSARVDAPGTFDFLSSLGDDAELVRFRNGHGEAVLNLHKVKAPTPEKSGPCLNKESISIAVMSLSRFKVWTPRARRSVWVTMGS